MEQYPQYFRKEGHCIRRDSATTAVEVQIPGPAQKLPLIFTPSTYPTRQRLDEILIDFEVTDQATYESFILTLCQHAAHFRDALNQKREARTIQQQTTIN